MLDFLGSIGHLIMTPLYYAVSAIMVAWHWLFTELGLDPDAGGTWALSIIGLTLVVRAMLIPLFVKQIKSSRNMQLIQPRVKELQKKYGHDRERLAAETMALYKETGTNPFASCLPILVQMPIFLGLYWVLIETVELRQQPWMGWIQNLTAPDPYFVLPALNLLTMWLTQKLSPTPGMDPLQKKMMQMMPLVFGVMMAFFPAGLVLYWVTNGALGLLQQWYMLRKYGQKPAAGTAVSR